MSGMCTSIPALQWSRRISVVCAARSTEVMLFHSFILCAASDTCSLPQPRVFRTSSFRLALIYAALTGVSFVILLAVIFFSTTRFMRHQIDDSVSSEVGEILADSQGKAPEAIRSVVQGLSNHPAGFYYLFQDAEGVAQ